MVRYVGRRGSSQYGSLPECDEWQKVEEVLLSSSVPLYNHNALMKVDNVNNVGFRE